MDLNNLFKNVNKQNVILACATVIGAWGGFPEPNPFIKKITKHKIVQYLLVYILVYQGGGGQDHVLSFIITILFYIANNYINYSAFM